MMEEEEIEVNHENLYNYKYAEIIEAKFNLITRVQPKAFDKDTYKPEEKISVKNDKGGDEVKEIPLYNYIRWRNRSLTDADENDEEVNLPGFRTLDKNKKAQGNSKIVEWSDGSMSLIIGDDYFDISLSNIDNFRLGVNNKKNDLLIVNQPVQHRMLLTPSEFTDTKRIEKLADQNQNESKVKLAYSYYDKQSYNKDEYGSKFSKKKVIIETSKKITDNNLLKKRKRSSNSDK